MSNDHFVEEVTIEGLTDKQRLSDILGPLFVALQTRSAARKAIKKGQIKINQILGTTATWISNGDVITFTRATKLVKTDYRFDIVFEDDYLVVINKPADLAVSGNHNKTITALLPGNVKTSNVEDALPKPMPVHRLDSATVGLLIIAKTRSAQLSLHRMIDEHQIDKRYLAVIQGQLTDSTVICELNIDDQSAKTTFRVQRTSDSQRFGKLSIIEAELHTGRTHQIRLHTAMLGLPILGDRIHGSEGTLKGKGLFLCSYNLSFEHPILDSRVEVNIDPPAKFARYMDYEEKRTTFAL